ncbi:hypothetical protein CsatB_019517 [Cannabis sativa]
MRVKPRRRNHTIGSKWLRQFMVNFDEETGGRGQPGAEQSGAKVDHIPMITEETDRDDNALKPPVNSQKEKLVEGYNEMMGGTHGASVYTLKRQG